MRADNAKALRPSYGPYPLINVKLCKYMLYVRFHCLGRDPKVARDFLVGSASGNQFDDISLACA
jgi:hypothetical protein